MKIQFLIFLNLLTLHLFGMSSQPSSPSLVKLEPPPLSPESILKEVVCTRPSRDGPFNISLEIKDGKRIVHCYGHGGAGWTTLFGSVYKAIELLKNEIDPAKPIRIIGSGCMGLTSAIELAKMGYKISGISTKSLYDCPSWKAGGYFGLISKASSGPEEKTLLDEISQMTFLTYRQIESGNHPYLFKDAVRYMPIYCSENLYAGIENLEEMGLIPPREYVTLDFGNGVLRRNFIKYMSYFMNTSKLMLQLQKEVAKLGIPIELKEIGSFDEISEDVIFNCTGLGAKELNNDEKMFACRGHLLLLKPEAHAPHMDYMICTTLLQTEKTESLYIFPKDLSVTELHPKGTPCGGVLGGTFITIDPMSTPSELEELDRIEFDRLLKRHVQFFLKP